MWYNSKVQAGLEPQSHKNVLLLWLPRGKRSVMQPGVINAEGLSSSQEVVAAEKPG